MNDKKFFCTDRFCYQRPEKVNLNLKSKESDESVEKSLYIQITSKVQFFRELNDVIISIVVPEEIDTDSIKVEIDDGFIEIEAESEDKHEIEEIYIHEKIERSYKFKEKLSLNYVCNRCGFRKLDIRSLSESGRIYLENGLLLIRIRGI